MKNQVATLVPFAVAVMVAMMAGEACRQAPGGIRRPTAADDAGRSQRLVFRISGRPVGRALEPTAWWRPASRSRRKSGSTC